MRLALTPSVETKDGVSNKNARLTNCLKEVKKSGEKAVIRPGLVLSDTYTGLGNGLIPFDGRLLVIYEDTVTDGDLWPWPLDSSAWSSATTYGVSDAVWYGGGLWFSLVNGNLNHIPSSGSYWDRAFYVDVAEYSAATLYASGTIVSYNGVFYRSQYIGNGVTPGSGLGLVPDPAETGLRQDGPLDEAPVLCVVNYAPLINGRYCKVTGPAAVAGKLYMDSTMNSPMWVAL